MWTSVPQIDATFTRIRTSVGPSDGIGTVRISVLFGAGFDFTAAFIVDAIPNFPPDRSAHGPWVFQLSIVPFVRSRRPVSWQLSPSPLDRMQLRRAVADEDEQVLARSKLLVEARISRVDPEHRRRDEFARRGDDGHVSGSDAPEHGRTDLKIPASEDEALPADGAHHQLCLRVSVEEAEDRGLVHILRGRLPSDDGVDPEQGLLDPQRGCDPLNRGAGPQQEERIRIRFEQLREMCRQLRADGLLAQLLDHELPGGHELRLDEGLRSGEEPDPPFSLAIGFLVQVENFGGTHPKLTS